jgi:hypothetical protein
LRLPNLEGQVPAFIFPRNRVAQIYPRALGSLSIVSYDLQGYGGGIPPCLHTGELLLFSIVQSHSRIHQAAYPMSAVGSLAKWDVKLKQYIQSPFIVNVYHLMN